MAERVKFVVMQRGRQRKIGEIGGDRYVELFEWAIFWAGGGAACKGRIQSISKKHYRPLFIDRANAISKTNMKISSFFCLFHIGFE